MPERRQPLYKEEIIPVTAKTSDIILEAFTAVPFRRRATAGINRIKNLQAESGFSVITDGQTIIYSAMQLGGANPQDAPNPQLSYQVGSTARTSLGLRELLEEIDINKISNDKRNELSSQEANPHGSLAEYSVLGTFHFHPYQTHPGFSNKDITVYENLPQQVRNWGMATATENMYNGVFLNTEIGKSPETVLFMYKQGPNTTTYYQGYDFDYYSYARQKDILVQSGMDIVTAKIPLLRGSADLTLLATNLEQRQK